MKQFTSRPISLHIRLALMCGFIMAWSTTALGQKDTCIINDQIVHNCDLRNMDAICTKNGQLLPCKKAPTPQKTCGGGSGLLILKLNRATTYYERYDAYKEMDGHLKCLGVNVGTFGAASDVTFGFSVDENFPTLTGEYSLMTNEWFNSTSAALVVVNAEAFKELAETRQLVGLEGRPVTDPTEIDTHLIAGEQLVVGKLLNDAGPRRPFIVADINARIKMVLDNRLHGRLSANMRAIAAVRVAKRASNKNAEFDYGNFEDRVAVGIILAASHRK